MGSEKGKKWAGMYKIRWRTKKGGKLLTEGVQVLKLSCGPNTTGDAGGNPPWKTRRSLHQVDPEALVWEGAAKMCKLIRKDRQSWYLNTKCRKKGNRIAA